MDLLNGSKDYQARGSAFLTGSGQFGKMSLSSKLTVNIITSRIGSTMINDQYQQCSIISTMNYFQV